MALGQPAAFLLALLLVLSTSSPAFAESRKGSPPPPVQVDFDWYSVGSAVVTAANLPARGALCGIAITAFPLLWSWFALFPDPMYDGGASAAAALVGDTCEGPWTVSPEMIKEWHEARERARPAP